MLSINRRRLRIVIPFEKWTPLEILRTLVAVVLGTIWLSFIVRALTATYGSRSYSSTAGEIGWVFWSGRGSLVEWVMVVVTLYAIVVAWRTLGAIETQAATARRMSETAFSAERAWISLETLDLKEFRAGSSHLCVVGLQNSGRTPAFIARGQVGIEIGGKRPTRPPYDTVTWDQQYVPSVLVANEMTNWRRIIVKTISSDDYQAIIGENRDNPKKLWVFGRIEYRDVFHRNHSYGFAREYDPSITDARIGERFRHVRDSEWNYAD